MHSANMAAPRPQLMTSSTRVLVDTLALLLLVISLRHAPPVRESLYIIVALRRCSLPDHPDHPRCRSCVCRLRSSTHAAPAHGSAFAVLGH
ncbi:hypothetical protein K458DRAFT_185091 [Lentithecium fluviatile CBS 122367]|uniref:Secreted protein n=1 Tax=Lentithecium fluviatile CBS 122367 TaxID=1168545 RepID=A0A6G1J9Y9_9PLEO|nr:hypothetical protein K458DRAFT_185091 [Lentithecium fluviatile CBS 122367]